MKMSRKKIAILVVGLLVVAGIVIQAVWRPFAHRKAAENSEIVLDIHHPDAVIDSEALSRLPRDILRVPLLHDVLTQDFVDYYESNDTRLSTEGALRRLAFEHQLDWRDELIRRVFDEPAHVLLWRSPDGRLGYWVMSMHRNGLAKLLQGFGNVAASDSQLSQVAKLSGDVPVYALKLAVGRTILFATKDDRLVVMSAPGRAARRERQLAGRAGRRRVRDALVWPRRCGARLSTGRARRCAEGTPAGGVGELFVVWLSGIFLRYRRAAIRFFAERQLLRRTGRRPL